MWVQSTNRALHCGVRPANRGKPYISRDNYYKQMTVPRCADATQQTVRARPAGMVSADPDRPVEPSVR